jgi:hypothetical protein
VTFEAIGTRWAIETDEQLPRPVVDHILTRTDEFDSTYSRFRPDSLVSAIAAAPEGGCFTFPEDSVPLFDLYDRLAAETGVLSTRSSAASWSCSATTRVTRSCRRPRPCVSPSGRGGG